MDSQVVFWILVVFVLGVAVAVYWAWLRIVMVDSRILELGMRITSQGVAIQAAIKEMGDTLVAINSDFEKRVSTLESQRLNERLIALETTNKPPAEPKKEDNFDPAASWQVQRNRAESGALNGR